MSNSTNVLPTSVGSDGVTVAQTVPAGGGRSRDATPAHVPGLTRSQIAWAWLGGAPGVWSSVQRGERGRATVAAGGVTTGVVRSESLPSGSRGPGIGYLSSETLSRPARNGRSCWTIPYVEARAIERE